MILDTFGVRRIFRTSTRGSRENGVCDLIFEISIFRLCRDRVDSTIDLAGTSSLVGDEEGTQGGRPFGESRICVE